MLTTIFTDVKVSFPDFTDQVSSGPLYTRLLRHEGLSEAMSNPAENPRSTLALLHEDAVNSAESSASDNALVRRTCPTSVRDIFCDNRVGG